MSCVVVFLSAGSQSKSPQSPSPPTPKPRSTFAVSPQTQQQHVRGQRSTLRETHRAALIPLCGVSSSPLSSVLLPVSGKWISFWISSRRRSQFLKCISRREETRREDAKVYPFSAPMTYKKRRAAGKCKQMLMCHTSYLMDVALKWWLRSECLI